MPRSSASRLTQRCGESGLTFITLTRRKIGCAKSRSAAFSAPLKLGMRPCTGNGKRAAFFRVRASHTALRAAALPGNRRAVVREEAAGILAAQAREDLTQSLDRDLRGERRALPAHAGAHPSRAQRDNNNVFRKLYRQASREKIKRRLAGRVRQ